MITKLEVENFRRIKAVSIEPQKGATIIAGENDAGKSSLLDAIKAAIGGKKHRPAKPIRDGAKKARILLETEEVVVTLMFTAKGERLKVEGKDGTKWGSPQQALNKWWGDLSFDPLEFVRLKGQEQVETLRRLVGLDFSDLDLQRQVIYDKRTALNRDRKRLEGAIANCPTVPPDTPSEFSSAASLGEQLEQAIATNTENAGKRARLTGLRDLREAQTKNIADLERQLASIRALLAETCEKGKALKLEVDALQDIDTEAIREQIANVEKTNTLVRAKIERGKLKSELDAADTEAEKLTDEIEKIDGRKAAMIEAAQYPVPGMSVDDDGVMLDGHPFSQASQSDQLRTSFAVGLALNPGKLMISKDGSLLGDKKLALLDEMARKADAQVFVEVVGDRKGATLVVEDGGVKA